MLETPLLGFGDENDAKRVKKEKIFFLQLSCDLRLIVLRQAAGKQIT